MIVRSLAIALYLTTWAYGADTPATVTTAFTPNCGRLLLENIREARKEIKVAIYEFTKMVVTLNHWS